jgi:hypothetical protein
MMTSFMPAQGVDFHSRTGVTIASLIRGIKNGA